MMANEEHVKLLIAGAASTNCRLWNSWKKDHPDVTPDLEEADLSKANLSYVDLSGANLRRVNLSRANLSGADLMYANLSSANLDGTRLMHADLRNADLSGADMRHAHARGANLSGADLYGADLRDADLRGANVRDANLFGARIDRIDLRGAINAKLYAADTKAAGIEGPGSATPLNDTKDNSQPDNRLSVGIMRLAKMARNWFKR